MRNLNVVLCEVCREELTLDGYTTVNPIENPLPSNTTVTVTKPASQVFSFTNLVPASSSPRIRWYVDNVLRQTGGTSFQFVSSAYTTATHALRLEVLDQTAFVRKDPSNKRQRTHTWSVIVKDAVPGSYSTYGSGCGAQSPRIAIGNAGAPEIGKAFQITLANARPNAIAALWLGYSAVAIPLPASRAPGCSLYATLEVFPLASRLTDGNGFASVLLGVPNVTALRGARFYNEWFVLDPSANPLGMAFSDGGAAQVGG